MTEEITYTDEEIAAAQKAMRDVAELYFLTFGTDTGQKVLEHFDNVAKQSSLQSNDFMDAQVNLEAGDFMFMREGQDQVIRFIHRMINFYKENK